LKRMKVFCCFSGGKESCLSLYKAMQIENIKVKYLLNMINEDGKYSRSHGISSNLLKEQASAIGIPIVQRKTTWENYEEKFKKVVSKFKEESNIEIGIFGDIDLQEHRDWIERVCQELKIKPILPLWTPPTHHPNIEREKLLKEFIKLGFKAIVVSTRANLLGKEWLGRQIDYKFIQDLKNLSNIDLCGEKGEYHTYVFDGPIFKKPVEFITGKTILKDKHWFLEIKKK